MSFRDGAVPRGDGEWAGAGFDTGGGVFDWRRDRSGTWSVVDAGRVTEVAGSEVGVLMGPVTGRVKRVAPCGKLVEGDVGDGGRPGAGTGLEGSRPSASGKNANENWADR